MACPLCHGDERIPLAPGFWECRSSVREDRPGRVPDPMGPPGATMPITDTIYRPCGTQYHEATGGGVTLLCECSTFAIGVCAACMNPVCGHPSCSGLHGGKRLCIQHLRAKEEAAARAAMEAWLTPQKFLALAAAAGNPGLQSWTILKMEKVPHRYRDTYNDGLFARTKTIYREEVVGTYEVRGWVVANYPNHAILTDDGRIHGLERGLFKPPDESSEPSLADIKTFDERFLKFDDPDWGGWLTADRLDLQDGYLRKMCEWHGIPI
jgi:hypothetical protein